MWLETILSMTLTSPFPYISRLLLTLEFSIVLELCWGVSLSTFFSSHSPASWPARHVRVAERSLQLSICCKGFSQCKMPPASFNFISDAVASSVQPDLNCSCAWCKFWAYYSDKINSLLGRKLLMEVKLSFSFEKQAGCEINQEITGNKKSLNQLFGGIYLAPLIV